MTNRTFAIASSKAPLLIEAALVAAILATYLALVAPTLGRPLLESHAFRQTQTAYTARIYHEQGIDLLHPRLPVLGEPFEVPFEFPLFQAAASIAMDLGMRTTRLCGQPDSSASSQPHFCSSVSCVTLPAESAPSPRSEPSC